MSDEEREAQEHAGRLLAVVNLLAEMSLQALRQGEADAARGFVDCIESLQVKTKGNTGETEDQMFEGVLYQLRMAVIKGPPPPAETEGGGGEEGGGDGEPEGAPPSEKDD